MSIQSAVTTTEFFATRPVFSLDEAARVLAPPGGRKGTVERLKHHVRKGRLKLVTRGVYAIVPAGVPVDRFQPDPILVAAAVRPDGIFAHHAALDLLGAAHSVVREVSVFTGARRKPLSLGAYTIRFLSHPVEFADPGVRELGTRLLERRGRLVRTTGPERTLVEGFRRPGLVGGAEELVQSAAGLPTLDLGLVGVVLGRYDLARLWAAVGWFLERFQGIFHVPNEMLGKCERRRPQKPQYLERDRRGGVLDSRWNLIIQEALTQIGARSGG